MERIIVYVDDAPYGLQQLAPMRNHPAAGASAEPTHWVLVACAPRMTRRIGKWTSHAAREAWRAKWADKLFAELEPQLRTQGDRVSTVLAKGPLPQLTRQLVAQHGVARVLDARRPKLAHDLPPVSDDQPAAARPGWEVPGAVAGLGAVLLLAAE